METELRKTGIGTVGDVPWGSHFRREPPAILRYAVAVVSVSVALLITLWLRMELGQQATPIVALFLCAVILSGWFAGIGPGLLTIALSLLAIKYYFAAPIYSWAVDIKEIPRLGVFTLSAFLVGSLSTAQRSKTESLRRARDVLDETVQALKRTNESLHASIAERKRAEALLHAKEQEFRAIVENAPDQIIRYDRKFRRIYVNPAVAKFHGKPADTLIGKPLGMGIREAGLDVKEDEEAQIRERIATVFSTGKFCDYELKWTMPTGLSYFSVRLFPELDLSGSVVNVLGISRDITKRKVAEDELKKEKEILEKIFDNIPVMVGFVGDDGVKLVNPEWERTIGWTLKELREQNVDIFAEAYPDPRYRQEVLDFVAAATGEWIDLKIRVRDRRVIDAACAVVRLSDGTKVAIAQDITERKRAEDALRLSEDRVRLIIDTIPTMTWTTRPDGTLDFVNQRWLDYTGLTLEEAIEEPTRTVHPEDLPRAMENWLVVKASCEAYEDEMRLRRSDGEYRWFLVRIAPLLDELGNLLERYGVAIDIEERKRAEALLYAKEQEFRAIVENAPDHIARYDREFRRTYVNPALAKAYDLSAEAMIGKPMFSIIRETRLDIKEEELAQIRQRFAAVFETGKSYEFEINLPMPAGRRDYNVRLFPELDLAGSVINVLSIARDITESKDAEYALGESERRLAEAQQVAHIGYWESNLDTGKVIWSAETFRIFGLQPQNSIENFQEFIHAEDRPRQAEAMARLELGEHYDVEYRVVRPDGEVRLVHSHGDAIRDESGGQRRVFGTLQDVTEIKRAEEKLKATTEQLRSLSASLQSAREEEGIRIARELHDELGAALSSLRWDLEEVLEVMSESTDLSQVVGLRKRIEDMIELTDTTVNAVRRIASELRPIALDELGLGEAIEWQAQQFQERTGIIVQCNCALEDIYLSSDQSIAVFRIFQEALTNILRHAQASTVNIQLKEEAGEFTLTISDNGRGITDDEKSGQRTLGLLGMRERTHLIGGKIDITGSDGGGTAVILRIPITG
ncbi:MAG: domain S-box-containing protein [Acidobacteria bacterium]|nr:domain S-box-containing protein [Acidobacteriota bacterium]